MSVPIEATERVIVAGTPVPLFRASLVGWDMTGDAKRLVMLQSAEGEQRNPLVILLNWQENLKR